MFILTKLLEEKRFETPGVGPSEAPHVMFSQQTCIAYIQVLVIRTANSDPLSTAGLCEIVCKH